jgi:hypothetical protein
MMPVTVDDVPDSGEYKYLFEINKVVLSCWLLIEDDQGYLSTFPSQAFEASIYSK